MQTTAPLCFEIGVKSDPIGYRYSYDGLFRILERTGVRHLQLGTFFEIYSLPDAWFLDLRRRAEDHGIAISSIFAAHRELGGFFRFEEGWVQTAHKSYERLIEIGALVGAVHVGSNPGAVMRDETDRKEEAVACYIDHMKSLLRYAGTLGIQRLTIEPMSCITEPPTRSDEIAALCRELENYAVNTPGAAAIGLCTDTSHGWADEYKPLQESPEQRITAFLPWIVELHLKNTDSMYHNTCGFGPEECRQGIADLNALRRLLEAHSPQLPANPLKAYLEIDAPKSGRDYSDGRLEEQLIASIAHIREIFEAETPASPPAAITSPEIATITTPTLESGKILIAPSIMCADLLHLEESVRRLEEIKADLIHIDIMDAHFTPNMPLGLEPFRQLRSHTNLPFDAHLMVDINDFFVEQMADLGAYMVSVHVEACRHLDRTLSRIRSLDMKAGAALNPATPLSSLEYVLDRLDFILIMTVNPGYAGQALVTSGIRKLKDCRAWLDQHNLSIPIQVDGNVSFAHIPAMTEAGADILVAGTSSVFSTGAPLARNMEETRRLAEKGRLRRPHRI